MENTVLVLGYVWLEVTSAAGSRMLQLIDQFLNHNYTVVFASAAQKTVNSLDLNSYGVKERSIMLNSSSFDNFIKELNPDVVVFDRFMIEEQFGWRVAENCPKALRVLDMEDFHALRKVRHECLKKQVDFSVDYLLSSNIAKREVASILRCDLTLVISEYEYQLLIEKVKIDKQLLLCLPFLLSKIEAEDTQKWLPFNCRKDFVFIGNFLHAPNVDAVLQLKLIWEEIRKKLPKALLHIYGAYPSQQIKQLHNVKQGFLVHGFAESPDIVIGNAKIVLAPLRFGAGIKGKLTEAMILGTPSVTTGIGAEGMHRSLPWSGEISSIENFSKKAVELYDNEEAWLEAQNNGIVIVNKCYDKQILGNVFIEHVKDKMEKLDYYRKENFLGSLLHYQTLNAAKYMSRWIELKNNF